MGRWWFVVLQSSRTERTGFSLIEALIGLAAGTMLLGIAYGVLTTGSRIQARAGSKLAAVEDAELVFRRLGNDLAAAVRPPQLDGNRIEVSPSASWTFSATADGRSSHVERLDAGGERSLHLAGSLVAFQLKSFETASGMAISLALTSRGAQDAEGTELRETFFVNTHKAEPEWNLLNKQ